ncbi:Uncharacterised protein [Mycobacteroides abscessus subsp. abscessus]|nr:Uncharacterised protein [Mycobacteroides abscessus subsp. abscessus]
MNTAATACGGIGPRSRSSSRRVPPSISSITRKGCLPSMPWSKTATSPGCRSRATARASSRKRARNPLSDA